MKKLTTVTVFFLLVTSAFAQYFAPVGAKWTYDCAPGAINPPPYTVEPLTIEITKDTMINGLACREAEINMPFSIPPLIFPKRYIRSINDSVLVYSTVNNQFNLLYDFNANVGDTLQIYSEDFWELNILDSSLVSIDSVGFKNIKGITYRAYHQTCLSSISSCLEGGGGWVIDSLGVMAPYYSLPYIDKISYLFLAPIFGGPPNIYPLRCYSDSNTYYNYDNANCDTTYVVTSVEEVNTANFEIYPTVLSSDNVQINIKTSIKIPEEIKFYTLTGMLIPITVKTQNNRTQLLFNKKISVGIYLLRFRLENEMIISKIIVL